MAKKKLLLVVSMVLLLGVSFYSMQSKKAESAVNYQSIFPFRMSANRVGFFDQTAGRVFVYDSDLKYIVEVLQISKLGKPLKRIDWTQYLDRDDQRH